MEGGVAVGLGEGLVTEIIGFYCSPLFDVWLAHCRPCN